MKFTKKGFTLVELLIVIGLLGAIALIVIAAINPIESDKTVPEMRSIKLMEVNLFLLLIDTLPQGANFLGLQLEMRMITTKLLDL